LFHNGKATITPKTLAKNNHAYGATHPMPNKKLSCWGRQ